MMSLSGTGEQDAGTSGVCHSLQHDPARRLGPKNDMHENLFPQAAVARRRLQR